MQHDIGWERFRQAVEILAEDEDRIKGRLLTAYASQLCLVNPKEDLPDELRADFCQLRNAVSDADMPYGDGQRAAEKIKLMTEQEAASYARLIFLTFLKLSDERIALTAS